MHKDIGLEVAKPKTACTDVHCAFHGKVTVRGRLFVGTVIKMNTHNTAVVEWPRLIYLQKYQRYEKKRSRLQVHNPPCLEIKIGDKVRIGECRPISKTKNFVAIERLE